MGEVIKINSPTKSTFIGDLKIDDRYELILKTSSSFSLIYYREEIVNNGIISADGIFISHKLLIWENLVINLISNKQRAWRC